MSLLAFVLPGLHRQWPTCSPRVFPELPRAQAHTAAHCPPATVAAAGRAPPTTPTPQEEETRRLLVISVRVQQCTRREGADRKD